MGELKLWECALGFDLDHTLIRYKTQPFNRLVYDTLLFALINTLNYPPQFFENQPYQHSLASKGVVFDLKTGNFLLVSEGKRVVKVVHGSGESIKDPLTRGSESTLEKEEEEAGLATTHIYPGPISEIDFEASEMYQNDRFHSFISNYDTPAIQLMGLMVDYHDWKKRTQSEEERKREKAEKERLIIEHREKNPHFNETRFNHEYAYLMEDLLVCYSFTFESVEPPGGPYYLELIRNTGEYIYKRNHVREWLLQLKKQGLTTFLVTNSYFKPANIIMSYAYGADWVSLFDYVIVDSKKPHFFSSKDMFCEYNIETSSKGKKVDVLETGKIYCRGSSHQLSEIVKKDKKNLDMQFVYFGDNLLTDIMAAKLYSPWHTVSIVEEMEYDQINKSFVYHLSHQAEVVPIEKYEKWGSMFKYGDSISYWTNFITLHSSLCIPDIAAVADSKAFMKKHVFDYERTTCFHPTISISVDE